MFSPEPNRTYKFSLAIAKEFDAFLPDQPPIKVIPAGEVIRELSILADDGKLPGVADRTGLFKDRGHLNRIGSYAMAATHVATMFDEDPRGYPASPRYPPTHRKAGEVIEAIDPATAKVILQTVWDVLNTRERTGFSGELAFKTSSLPSALSGLDYSQKLEAVGGRGPTSLRSPAGHSRRASRSIPPPGRSPGRPRVWAISASRFARPTRNRRPRRKNFRCESRKTANREFSRPRFPRCQGVPTWPSRSNRRMETRPSFGRRKAAICRAG